MVALNTHSNALPDENGRVLVMQAATSGEVMGTLNAQIFPNGNGLAEERVSWSLMERVCMACLTLEMHVGARTRWRATMTPLRSTTMANVCLRMPPASAVGIARRTWMAMAFATMRIHALARGRRMRGGNAMVLEVYDCGCFDIPEGDCDYIGNQLDALFTCRGDCDADADGDNVCDEVENPCVGVYDECGICNGPGAVYACGCTSIPERGLRLQWQCA